MQGSPRPAGAHPPRPGIPPGAAAYRLADYLEQHGRLTRRALIPPHDFWYATACHARPGDLPALAAAADNRGLLRHAALLRKHAAGHGNIHEATALVRDMHALDPNSVGHGAAQWAATHAALDDPSDVASLLHTLQRAGQPGRSPRWPTAPPPAYLSTTRLPSRI